MGMRSRLLLLSTFFACFIVGRPLHAQQPNQLGKIIGNVRVVRGDFPAHPILISLDMRGTPIESAYCDNQGRFGFGGLVANQYTVSVNEDAYDPVRETTEVNPTTSSVNWVQITLVPRASAKKDPLPGRGEGSNPFLIDPAEYYPKFPQKTPKGVEKGVDADHQGKTDKAIHRYDTTLIHTPQF